MLQRLRSVLDWSLQFVGRRIYLVRWMLAAAGVTGLACLWSHCDDLTVGVLLILLATAFLAAATRRGHAGGLLCILIVSIILARIVLSYIGTGRGGMPQLERQFSLDRLQRVEHTGFYADVDHGFALRGPAHPKSGEEQDRSAPQSQNRDQAQDTDADYLAVVEGLAFADRIHFTAAVDQGGRVKSWHFSNLSTSKPLWIGGYCRNVRDDAYLKWGDTLTVVFPSHRS